MLKHAYMILAHKNIKQLGLLLSLLDSEKNDIYIHIDSKSKDMDSELISSRVKKSKVYFVERTSVKWASYSIVNATLLMLKSAIKHGPYAYYHLLSGQDLPLKPIEEINRFYDRNDPNWNYLNCEDSEWSRREVRVRTDYFSFYGKGSTVINGKLLVPRMIRKTVSIVKNRLTKYVAGAAWFDINQHLAELVVVNEKWIYRHFRSFLFPDESFVQTVVWKYGLNDSCHDNMRYIDWDNSAGQASPYVFKDSDYDRLVDSGKNFARKFDMDVDEEIVKKIYSHITGCSQKGAECG